MIIRAAHPTDGNAIAKVEVDTWRTTYADIVPGEYLADLSYERRGQYWRDVVSTLDSREFAYVAEDSPGQIVGFLVGGPERNGEAAYPGEIYWDYVLKSHQSKGTGIRLAVAAVKRILQCGWISMLVWVFAANRPARALYEHLGGRLVGEQETIIGGTRLIQVAYGWPDLREGVWGALILRHSEFLRR